MNLSLFLKILPFIFLCEYGQGQITCGDGLCGYASSGENHYNCPDDCLEDCSLTANECKKDNSECFCSSLLDPRKNDPLSSTLKNQMKVGLFSSKSFDPLENFFIENSVLQQFLGNNDWAKMDWQYQMKFPGNAKSLSSLWFKAPRASQSETEGSDEETDDQNDKNEIVGHITELCAYSDQLYQRFIFGSFSPWVRRSKYEIGETKEFTTQIKKTEDWKKKESLAWICRPVWIPLTAGGTYWISDEFASRATKPLTAKKLDDQFEVLGWRYDLDQNPSSEDLPDLRTEEVLGVPLISFKYVAVSKWKRPCTPKIRYKPHEAICPVDHIMREQLFDADGPFPQINLSHRPYVGYGLPFNTQNYFGNVDGFWVNEQFFILLQISENEIRIRNSLTEYTFLKTGEDWKAEDAVKMSLEARTGVREPLRKRSISAFVLTDHQSQTEIIFEFDQNAEKNRPSWEIFRRPAYADEPAKSFLTTHGWSTNSNIDQTIIHSSGRTMRSDRYSYIAPDGEFIRVLKTPEYLGLVEKPLEFLQDDKWVQNFPETATYYRYGPERLFAIARRNSTRVFSYDEYTGAVITISEGSPDSDGDGIADYADACWGTKGTEEFGGCKKAYPKWSESWREDSDGDGFPDHMDTCPQDKNLDQSDHSMCRSVIWKYAHDKDGALTYQSGPTGMNQENSEGQIAAVSYKYTENDVTVDNGFDRVKTSMDYDYKTGGTISETSEKTPQVISTYDNKGLKSVNVSSAGVINFLRQDGFVKSKTESNGEQTEYSLDDLGRIVQVKLNGVMLISSIKYQEKSWRPTTLKYVSGVSLAMTYTKDRISSFRRKESATADEEVTTYQYDSKDRLTKITQPNGAFVAYEFDVFSRPIKFTDSLGGSTIKEFYGASDKPLSTTNSTSGSYTWNWNKGQLRGFQGPEQNLSVEYNNLGMPKSVADSRSGLVKSVERNPKTLVRMQESLNGQTVKSGQAGMVSPIVPPASEPQ